MPPPTVDLTPYLDGTVACHTEDDLRAKLSEGRPLRVKLGVDPSSPDLHLGHTVQLRYLRRMQELGHQAVLIVGGATAMVGDPTGKNTTRPQLTRDQVRANARSYLDQAGLVIDLERAEVVDNHDWFEGVSFMDTIRMCAHVTVARMLERDTFATRHKAGVPIGLHEFLYPVMQAHDSVVVRADIEIGGTDQTFNLLMGRDAMREAGLAAQVCVTLPIIPGLDGEQKMSKSLGNAIGLTESPREMFGKSMSIPDELMPQYFALLTDVPDEEVQAVLEGPPREAKAALGRALTAIYHGQEAADEASREFDRMFRDKGLPDDIPEVTAPADLLEDGSMWIVPLLKALGLASSNGEARRLIQGGGVKLDGERVDDDQRRLSGGTTHLLQVGKRRFVKATLPG